MLGKYLIGHAISCHKSIILAHDLSRVTMKEFSLVVQWYTKNTNVWNNMKKSLPHQTVATDWNWTKISKNLVQLRCPIDWFKCFRKSLFFELFYRTENCRVDFVSPWVRFGHVKIKERNGKNDIPSYYLMVYDDDNDGRNKLWDYCASSGRWNENEAIQ